MLVLSYSSKEAIEPGCEFTLGTNCSYQPLPDCAFEQCLYPGCHFICGFLFDSGMIQIVAESYRKSPDNLKMLMKSLSIEAESDLALILRSSNKVF